MLKSSVQYQNTTNQTFSIENLKLSELPVNKLRQSFIKNKGNVQNFSHIKWPNR